MKLIDANKLFQETEENMHNSLHSDLMHTAMRKHEHCHFLCKIDKQLEIDPVHFAEGTYCSKCTHSEPLYKEINNSAYLYGYHCQKYHVTMPLKGFCSEGRKDEMKNA